MPGSKLDPAGIRVLTWNILVGSDRGPFWNCHDWATRSPALRAALRASAPDLLCVQEALDEQLEYLDATLPHHRRVGVGRDDGRSAGEHCAIYFDAGRFDRLDDGTFWLEEPADRPPSGWSIGPKRICSWARLRDRARGRTLRVYNVHLYLTEAARSEAIRILLDRVGPIDPAEVVLIAGDFNATPEAPSRRRIVEAGFASAADLAGDLGDAPTYQFYGIGLKAIDEIYLGGARRRVGRSVLDAKPGNTFPSDHFGVIVDLGDGP